MRTAQFFSAMTTQNWKTWRIPNADSIYNTQHTQIDRLHAWMCASVCACACGLLSCSLAWFVFLCCCLSLCCCSVMCRKCGIYICVSHSPRPHGNTSKWNDSIKHQHDRRIEAAKRKYGERRVKTTTTTSIESGKRCAIHLYFSLAFCFRHASAAATV